MDIKRGEICLVDFGTDVKGSELCGVHPAVIIQNDVGNMHSTTTIVAGITSKFNRMLPTNVAVNLKKKSRIMCEQVRTIEKTRIEKKLGNLGYFDMKKVDKALKVSMGLS